MADTTVAHTVEKKAAEADGRLALTEWRTKPDSPSLQQSGTTMLQGLALALGIFMVVVWGLKKFGGKRVFARPQRLKVLERAPVTPRTALMLVSLDGKEMLISVGAEKVTQLSGSNDDRRSGLNVETEINREGSCQGLDDEFSKDLDLICLKEDDVTFTA